MTERTSTIATNRQFLAMFPGGTDDEEGTALIYPEEEMDELNTYCATYQSVRESASQVSGMKPVLSRLTEKKTKKGRKYWESKLDKCHDVQEKLESCCRGFGGDQNTTDRNFMPSTTQSPKREDLDKWQNRSEKTLGKLKPKIQSLECQTQESKDYQACLTYLTAVNESRVTSTGKKDEETKRRDMYKMIQDKETAHVESASRWRSPGRPKSDIEEEHSNYDDVSLQHGSRIQETAVKKSRFGEKVMARLCRQK